MQIQVRKHAWVINEQWSERANSDFVHNTEVPVFERNRAQILQE
jgi:hypothetical protein